jgi:hypothetical protein
MVIDFLLQQSACMRKSRLHLVFLKKKQDESRNGSFQAVLIYGIIVMQMTKITYISLYHRAPRTEIMCRARTAFINSSRTAHGNNVSRAHRVR